MKIYEYFLNIIFKPSFTKDILDKLHNAPKHEESFIFSIFDYSHETTKKIIKYLKSHNDIILKKLLASKMYDYIVDYISDQQSLNYFINPIIVPVPVSKKRLRERGFNQTHLLAKYFAKNISGIYRKNIVQKNVTTEKQALIKDRINRFNNVKNVFSINKKYVNSINGKDFIIVDDLSTTGATIMEIRKILLKNKARNIIAITIAH